MSKSSKNTNKLQPKSGTSLVNRWKQDTGGFRVTVPKTSDKKKK